jgi:hypothetical protein
MFHTNSHCNYCKRCTSIGGVKQRHCDECNTCVKERTVHCHSCASCHPKNTPCPPISRCTVCASVSHRRHACPKLIDIVSAALQPWVISTDNLHKKSKVQRGSSKVRGVARQVVKRSRGKRC